MIHVTIEIPRAVNVAVTVPRSIGVAVEFKGVIGLTFSGIRDNVIDGNDITLLDTVIP